VVDESPATLARLEEVYAAIRERRFRPWHAGDLLAVAKTIEDRRAAVAKIVELVAGGAEGRRCDSDRSDRKGKRHGKQRAAV